MLKSGAITSGAFFKFMSGAADSWWDSAYTHQGWLTEDQGTFILGDEVDELEFGHNTRTYLFDVSDLDNPSLTSRNDADTEAIDHNIYTRGDYVYQANYRAGLRVLDGSEAASGELREVGFFDIYPADEEAFFNGAWSNYPYYDSSGVVAVNGIEQGLFILKPKPSAVKPQGER